jgi:hypothetical protein
LEEEKGCGEFEAGVAGLKLPTSPFELVEKMHR